MPLQGFQRRDGALHCEEVALAEIAERVGTPVYVYSASAILENHRAYDRALEGLDHEIHFAVKANSSLGVLALLARAGAGFDIVSGGELKRVLKAGGRPEKIVFSGVGKTRDEIHAALEAGVGAFHCESEAELLVLIDETRRLNASPAVGLRVNPDVAAATHPYIATGLRAHKFGVGVEEAERLYLKYRDALRLEGVGCHIGSQIFKVGAFLEALERVTDLADRLRAAGVPIRNLDLGGGLAVAYRPDEVGPEIAAYGAALVRALRGRGLRLMIEPGRSIIGPAGVLLTRVVYLKKNDSKSFVVVDAAMNDLIRPALYQAHHEIVPVLDADGEETVADIVGPVCETGDFLARDRALRGAAPDQLLAVATAGAYGFVLSSNYNSRPRAAEVLVEGSSWRVIRRRETFDDLIRGECV